MDDTPQKTPIEDHVQKALTEMRTGYRLNLDSLLDCHSASYGTEVPREIARRFDTLTARVTELEAENARLREPLELIDSLDPQNDSTTEWNAAFLMVRAALTQKDKTDG